jgi:hypothetical protein
VRAALELDPAVARDELHREARVQLLERAAAPDQGFEQRALALERRGPEPRLALEDVREVRRDARALRGAAVERRDRLAIEPLGDRGQELLRVGPVVHGRMLAWST